MEYKQIFIDLKRQDTSIRFENFARITVYAPQPASGVPFAPFLIQFEHGNNHYEDWEIEWSLIKFGSDANAIREAISRLDDHAFQKLET